MERRHSIVPRKHIYYAKLSMALSLLIFEYRKPIGLVAFEVVCVYNIEGESEALLAAFSVQYGRSRVQQHERNRF